MTNVPQKNRRFVVYQGVVYVFEEDKNGAWSWIGTAASVAPDSPITVTPSATPKPIVVHPSGKWGGAGHRVVACDCVSTVRDDLDEVFQIAAEVAFKRS